MINYGELGALLLMVYVIGLATGWAARNYFG